LGNVNKTTIITGAYGTGKTEFCINYALFCAGSSSVPVKLADMDVVNPYFRSREKAEFLAKNGVQIIGNLTENTGNQDLPAISGEVLRAVLAGDALVVDLAGSTVGLHTLTFFKAHLKNYDIWVVLNAFRDASSNAAKAVEFINAAESVSGLKVTGIVNNSHMLRETTKDHVLRGYETAVSVSDKTGIPLVYTFVNSTIYEDIRHLINSPVLTFSKLIMREDWQ
jgi:MinD-like ATPase involved in chromosome partitioning or flagellar assembly